MHVLEIVSGLEMGGAEKSFIHRLDFVPDYCSVSIINTMPKLNKLKIPTGFSVQNVPRSNSKFFFQLYREIQNLNPNIVIVRSPIDYIFVALVKFRAQAGWSLVFESHSTKISSHIFFNTLLRMPLKFSLKNADLVISVSNSVASGRQCEGARKIVTHHLGSRSDVLHRANGPLQFLFAGRMVPLKQPFLLLESISLLQDEFRGSNCLVKFVGTGSLERKIQNYIDMQNLSDIVSFDGYVESLDEFLAASDYLISCSKFEGLPLTFYEAKLNGLRVITTPSSGDFDLLGPEDLILPDFTRSSLIEAIRTAIKSGRPRIEEREEIQLKNAWMQSKSTSSRYYDMLESELF